MDIKLKCMKESIFITLQKCTVFEGFTPEEIREALSMVSYRMVELAARETYVLAGMPCRYVAIYQVYEQEQNQYQVQKQLDNQR